MGNGDLRAATIGIALALGCAQAASGAERAAPAQFDAIIAKHAAATGVPEALIRRVIVRESRYNPAALSRGHYGMMQIKPATARAMGYRGAPSGLLDADTNLTYAVRYLAGAYKVAGGNHDRAVGLYASGYYYQAKRRGMLATIGMGRDGKLSAPPAASVGTGTTQVAAVAAPTPPARPAVVPVAAVAPAQVALAPLPPSRPAAPQANRRTIDPAQPAVALAATVPTPQPRDVAVTGSIQGADPNVALRPEQVAVAPGHQSAAQIPVPAPRDLAAAQPKGAGPRVVSIGVAPALAAAGPVLPGAARGTPPLPPRR